MFCRQPRAGDAKDGHGPLIWAKGLPSLANPSQSRFPDINGNFLVMFFFQSFFVPAGRPAQRLCRAALTLTATYAQNRQNTAKIARHRRYAPCTSPMHMRLTTRKTTTPPKARTRFLPCFCAAPAFCDGAQSSTRRPCQFAVRHGHTTPWVHGRAGTAWPQHRQQGERLTAVVHAARTFGRIGDHREEVGPPLGGGLDTPEARTQVAPSVAATRQDMLDERMKC